MLFHIFFKKVINDLEVTWRILLDPCHPITDLTKSPDERGDSGRTTDKGYVMESCTAGHVVCVCSNVLNPRTWET